MYLNVSDKYEYKEFLFSSEAKYSILSLNKPVDTLQVHSFLKKFWGTSIEKETLTQLYIKSANARGGKL